MNRDKTGKVIATDCDGVLTPMNGVFYDDRGRMFKQFSSWDSYGIDFLKRDGYDVVIITKDDSNITRRRAQKLKVPVMVVQDKREAISILRSQYDTILFVGHSPDDYIVINMVDKFFAPLDAFEEVIADPKVTILPVVGGKGVLYELWWHLRQAELLGKE